ncbi:hypothetical protein O9649_11545 [Achromobacter dolens]|uniref:hypothetical protein n=1 Tax=Achromobacter TaxID=222 RepID=UPI0022B93B3F|nr:hypothetical protein [Achromobacter dolens]MCZ8408422.1 hypothetical protein [Achromobacter dolens]
MTSIEKGKGTGAPEPAYYENAPSGASMEAMARPPESRASPSKALPTLRRSTGFPIN